MCPLSQKEDADGSHLTACFAPACQEGRQQHCCVRGGCQGLGCCHPGRAAILERKRLEYRDMVPDYYDIADRSADELGALRQVRVLGYCKCKAEGFVALSRLAWMIWM